MTLGEQLKEVHNELRGVIQPEIDISVSKRTGYVGFYNISFYVNDINDTCILTGLYEVEPKTWRIVNTEVDFSLENLPRMLEICLSQYKLNVIQEKLS